MKPRAWRSLAALSCLCSCAIYDDSLLADSPPSGSGGAASGGGPASAGGQSAAGGAASGSGGASGGSVTGSGGTEAQSCDWGTSTPRSGVSLLDDFADNDKWIASAAGRSGRWNTDNDGSAGTQSPSGLGWESFPMSERDDAPDNYALHYQGSGFASWHLVLAELSSGAAIDLRAYDGVVLWLRADCGTESQVQVRIALSDAESFGSAGAIDHAGLAVPFALGSQWRELVIPFSSLERRFGSQTTFDASTAHAFLVSPNAPGSLDVWLDDIAFYTD